MQPGDLILIKTPSTLYDVFRRMASQEWDHVAVVVDNDDCESSLHITYPRAKFAETFLFTCVKRRPVIIRPLISPEAMSKFLVELKQHTIGKHYDFVRVLHFGINHVIEGSTKKIKGRGSSKRYFF